MHPDESLEYQFAAASSKAMIKDLARVTLSPLAYGSFVGHEKFVGVSISHGI
jgi:hypothetical protein